MPDPLLTTHDAAAYLHVSPRTLEKWRLQGGARATASWCIGWSIRNRTLTCGSTNRRARPPVTQGHRRHRLQRAAVSVLPSRRRASRAKY